MSENDDDLGDIPARSGSRLRPDPGFFSDQYDVGMEYVGYTDGSEEVVFRGDVHSGEFIALWLKDGKINAGMNVNVWDASETIRDLIEKKVEIDSTALTDPEVDLGTLG